MAIFDKQWWIKTLQLNEVSNTEVIDRIVTGFKLVPAKQGFSNSYTTKKGKATVNLAKQIHAWAKKEFPNNPIGIKFEKTYGTINLNESVLQESPPINFEADDYENYVNQNRGLIEKAAAEFNFPIQDMLYAFTAGAEVVLSDDIWSKLENSKSYKIKSLDEAIQIALKAGIDPKPYIDFIKDGKELPLPMVLCYAQDKYYLVGGDLILSLYKALGSIPTILQGTLNMQNRTLHEPLEEDIESSVKSKHADIVKYFLKFAVKELGLKKLPSGITLSYNTEQAKDTRSFGTFNPENDHIWLYVKDRNTADFLRTLAHELVHRKQAEDGRLEPGDGATGSDIENEANAQAGILLRKFGKEHEDIYETLNEMKVNNPSNLVIIEVGSGDGLLVEDTYLFTDYFATPDLKERYEIVDASIEVDEDRDGKKYISINFPEPSFGGGASEADIENSYDYWEANCAIGEKVLTKYSYKHDYDFYKIDLNNVTNADLLNEMKVNNPSVPDISDWTIVQNDNYSYTFLEPNDKPGYIEIDQNFIGSPNYQISGFNEGGKEMVKRIANFFQIKYAEVGGSIYTVLKPKQFSDLMPENEVLNEYNFGLEQAFDWKYKGGPNSKYLFTTGQTKYEVIFRPDPEGEGLYERIYKPVGSIPNVKTGEGKPLPVIATVTAITLDFMKNNKDWHTITIQPISENRYRAVIKFLDVNIPGNKYNIEEIEGIINITRKLSEVKITNPGYKFDVGDEVSTINAPITNNKPLYNYIDKIGGRRSNWQAVLDDPSYADTEENPLEDMNPSTEEASNPWYLIKFSYIGDYLWWPEDKLKLTILDETFTKNSNHKY